MTNTEILQRLFTIVKQYKYKLGLAMFAMIMVSLFTGMQAILIKDLIDDIFIGKNKGLLLLLPVIVIFVFFVKSCFYFIYQYVLVKVGQSFVMDMRVKVFDHIHSQSLSFFHSTPTGTLVARILNDVAQMQAAVSNALVGILRDFTQAVILLGVVFYMNWQLAMLTFIIIPIALIPIVVFGKMFRNLSKRSQQETAVMTNILFETITANSIVKAFGMEKYEGTRFRNQINKLFDIVLKTARIRCLQHPMMEMIGGVAVSLIIWFGGTQVINGTTTPGAFFAFFTALIAAYEPVKGISSINATIQNGLAAAERVFNILDIKPEILDAPDAVKMQPFTNKIEFDDISFCYNENKKVLKNISLTIPNGENLAIVGPSGGGKTTITNLVPRFLEIEEGDGAILIDGQDIRKLTMNSLRNQISVVSQKTILFKDTIRNNIAYGNLDATDQEIEKAAKAAYAAKFIEKLPDGYNTEIGEDGAKLSGGERQRISIARAILKDAPILILDEATSALDTESEREVQNALNNLMKNKTTMVIAHRLSTIKNADRIIVIKNGEIVEQGTHDSLMKLHGEYELLYNMQFR